MATNEKTTTAATSFKSQTTGPRRPPNTRMVQNFHLVWLDESIDEENNEDCRNSMTKLHQIVNTVNTFTDADECIDFITDSREENTFMIVSEALSQIIVPLVQDIPQVRSVYVFSENKTRHEKEIEEWPKVKGVYTDIIPIFKALKQATHDCDHNSISISFVKTTDATPEENLDTLDPSFMYTQILKEILLTITFKPEHINEFLTYCREQFADNTTALANVTRIENEYLCHLPIWWYTYDCFLYSMLNRALRTMEVDLIIKMGFFVRDLHNHIAALHAKQYDEEILSNSLTVYRGQGLSQTDFDQLKTTQGGLLSFNNFLSTSLDRAVSLAFADSNQNNADLTGVLFEITINQSISSSPFANVQNVSYFKEEEEILFSMHTVFRIGQVKQIDKNNRLWQVDLTLTSDNDPQLQALTESMREETRGSTGWDRLGHLMIKLGQFNRAEELYEILLQQTNNESEKAHLFHQLGYIKNGQGRYTEAAECYEKSLEISQKTLPANHPHLATSYSNIGSVHDDMGEYSKALLYYERALEIYQNTLPSNHPDLATCYNNIGWVYKNMAEYSKALSCHEKALEIFQKILPANHPDLAISYSKIGSVYNEMGEYAKAVSYHEKTLQIFQKTLSANHPILASFYNNIGNVYNQMDEYSKALSYYEKALAILQKTLSVNHPDLASSYNSIGLVHHNMGDYSKALSYYEKALEIYRKTLPPNHPYLATSYNNIGGVYQNIGAYSKALSYYEKAVEILQKTLPANHPNLAGTYSNIAQIYYGMGDYFSAYSFIQRAVDIGQHSLPASHPNLQLYRAELGNFKKKL